MGGGITLVGDSLHTYISMDSTKNTDKTETSEDGDHLEVIDPTGEGRTHGILHVRGGRGCGRNVCCDSTGRHSCDGGTLHDSGSLHDDGTLHV